MHPSGGPFTNTKTGTLQIPTSGHDFQGATRYEIVLTVTDSAGLTASTSVTVIPDKVNLTFDTVPSGLTVQIDGISRQAPFVVDEVKGFQHTITAPTQSSGGARTRSTPGPTGAHRATQSSSRLRTRALSPRLTRPPLPRVLLLRSRLMRVWGRVWGMRRGMGMWVRLGSASWMTTGRFGNALSFNGAGARVTVPDSGSLDLTSAMTLEAWVFPTVGGGWRDVIYKGPDDIYFLESSSDSGAPATGGTFASPIYGSSALPLNVWSHLAATYDGATLRLFVGGVQVSSRAVLAPIATSTGALTIGGDALYGQHFAGRIDEVRVYGRALSASEIQTDMTTPMGSAGPAGYAGAVGAGRASRRRRCRRRRSIWLGRRRPTTSR